MIVRKVQFATRSIPLKYSLDFKVWSRNPVVACYRTNRKLHSKCDSVTCHAIRKCHITKSLQCFLKFLSHVTKLNILNACSVKILYDSSLFLSHVTSLQILNDCSNFLSHVTSVIILYDCSNFLLHVTSLKILNACSNFCHMSHQ